jgi:hypothetical protein
VNDTLSVVGRPVRCASISPSAATKEQNNIDADSDTSKQLSIAVDDPVQSTAVLDASLKTVTGSATEPLVANELAGMFILVLI